MISLNTRLIMLTKLAIRLILCQEFLEILILVRLYIDMIPNEMLIL